MQFRFQFSGAKWLTVSISYCCEYTASNRIKSCKQSPFSDLMLAKATHLLLAHRLIRLNVFASRSCATQAVMYAVDAHVHIWTPEETNYPVHKSHPLPPSLSTTGDAASLLAAMDGASIQTALVVQPINYMHDHSYITTSARAHPTRLRAISLALLSESPDTASAALQRDVNDNGCIGVRINPSQAPLGLKDPSVDAVMRTAAELDIPVALFAKTMAGVEDLVARHPTTRLVVDHFAFCTPGERDDDFRDLLRLGRQYKNAYVKTSAFFRVSKEIYPYSDLQASVIALVEAFSAKRVLFGTDFPYVTEQCTYKESWDVLNYIPLSKEDREMVRGGAAAQLYKLS